jgi:signal transduction histidine kinase
MAVYDDRDRMARDLHDTVIQRPFAVGLSLQTTAGTAREPGIRDRLETAISELDDTIRQVRSTIYELGSAEIGRGVRDSLLSLVRELTSVVGFEVRVTFDGAVDAMVSDQLAEHLLAVVREAVTNIGRHAQATEASVFVGVTDRQCRLPVTTMAVGSMLLT